MSQISAEVLDAVDCARTKLGSEVALRLSKDQAGGAYNLFTVCSELPDWIDQGMSLEIRQKLADEFVAFLVWVLDAELKKAKLLPNNFGETYLVEPNMKGEWEIWFYRCYVPQADDQLEIEPTIPSLWRWENEATEEPLA